MMRKAGEAERQSGWASKLSVREGTALILYVGVADFRHRTPKCAQLTNPFQCWPECGLKLYLCPRVGTSSQCTGMREGQFEESAIAFGEK